MVINVLIRGVVVQIQPSDLPSIVGNVDNLPVMFFLPAKRSYGNFYAAVMDNKPLSSITGYTAVLVVDDHTVVTSTNNREPVVNRLSFSASAWVSGELAVFDLI